MTEATIAALMEVCRSLKVDIRTLQDAEVKATTTNRVLQDQVSVLIEESKALAGHRIRVCTGEFSLYG
jgi:hypothetical protein